ncbi:hypothetical protein CDD82_1414 [Ophiocordyceps australis]|uniref:Phosphomevalonate kinase n=1 Tax=Ophiocordyceps australis TaxID=1399860 RepID=A0A2C5ZGC0_9HYPO|nr:hypothetical protein CDD82_1414 [Ophiocordyceps australis]
MDLIVEAAMDESRPTVAVSAPGKVLLAGGYLVLDRKHSGLVLGLSARINVAAGAIHTSEGVQLNEIVVDSPQFVEAQWRYGYHRAPEDGGIKVTQLQVGCRFSPNRFIETTLCYALTYIDCLAGRPSQHKITPARLVVLADNDYYSPASSTHPHAPSSSRFAHMGVRLADAHKTGLGSSAALVTALTAALLSHYLPTAAFDLSTPPGRRILHTLAQAAHCAAQAKLGSGFDVAAAVYGSCLYRRFSPDLLAALADPGTAGFGASLASLVDSQSWDMDIQPLPPLPPGLSLRMCDVDCGSHTVAMAKQLLAWRARDPPVSEPLWDKLQRANHHLAALLAQPSPSPDLSSAIAAIRHLLRTMAQLSGVPIEPPSQTQLLDALTTQVQGVYGGVVPGAGGYDALALLVRDDPDTASSIASFLSQWSKDTGTRVRLLSAIGQHHGARSESLDVYAGWL